MKILIAFFATALLAASAATWGATNTPSQPEPPPLVPGTRHVIFTAPSQGACRSNCLAVQRLGNTDIIKWRGVNGELKSVTAVRNGRPALASRASSATGGKPLIVNVDTDTTCTNSHPPYTNCFWVYHFDTYDLVAFWGASRTIERWETVPTGGSGSGSGGSGGGGGGCSSTSEVVC